MNMYENLIGENEENVIRFMRLHKLEYDIVYTKSPKAGENQSDKRVIRLKMDKNNRLKILVGFFKPPVA